MQRISAAQATHTCAGRHARVHASHSTAHAYLPDTGLTGPARTHKHRPLTGEAHHDEQGDQRTGPKPSAAGRRRLRGREGTFQRPRRLVGLGRAALMVQRAGVGHVHCDLRDQDGTGFHASTTHTLTASQTFSSRRPESAHFLAAKQTNQQPNQTTWPSCSRRRRLVCHPPLSLLLSSRPRTTEHGQKDNLRTRSQQSATCHRSQMAHGTSFFDRDSCYDSALEDTKMAETRSRSKSVPAQIPDVPRE